MKVIRKLINNRFWLTFPCTLMFGLILCTFFLLLPLAKTVVNESYRLYRHYEKKQNASLFPLQEKQLRNEIALLDSVIKNIETCYRHKGKALIDELYTYADSSNFKTNKVEAGEPQLIGMRQETAVSIEGIGTYRSIGKFIERIENSKKSTRIRQLIIKEIEKGDPEVFIDIVLRE